MSFPLLENERIKVCLNDLCVKQAPCMNRCEESQTSPRKSVVQGAGFTAIAPIIYPSRVKITGKMRFECPPYLLLLHRIRKFNNSFDNVTNDFD